MTFRKRTAQFAHSVVAFCWAIAFAAPALAAPNVATDSAVFVEREGTRNEGRRLEPVDELSRGDRIVTIVRWYRLGGDGSFTIINPLPRTVAYQKSSLPGEEVSVDGGKSWGRLGVLRVGLRVATPEDVTHVRWHIPAQRAAKGAGQIAYSGIVR